MPMHRNVPSVWLQSVSDTQDSQTPRELRTVPEHMRVAGLQLSVPQSVASLAGAHSRHIPPKQRGVPLRWLQWVSFMQMAQVSPLQRDAATLVQWLLVRHCTHCPLTLHAGVSGVSAQSDDSLGMSQATHAPVPTLQVGNAA